MGRKERKEKGVQRSEKERTKPVRSIGPGTGGRGQGACPSNFWTGGAPPLQLLTADVLHFYFCLFLYVKLGPFQKIVGEILEVFSFG